MEIKNFNFYSKSSYISWLALSDSFEYLCYGCTTIINICTLPVRGSVLDVDLRDIKVNIQANSMGFFSFFTHYASKFQHMCFQFK